MSVTIFSQEEVVSFVYLSVLEGLKQLAGR